MSLIVATFVCLFVVVHVASLGLSEKAVNKADQQSQPLVAPKAARNEHHQQNKHQQHQDSNINTEYQTRSKRDSSETERYVEDKRIRDVVGKRSQTYPSISELNQLTPLRDISDFTVLPQETAADDEDEQLYGFDFDGSNNSEGELEKESWSPHQFTSFRDFPEMRTYSEDSDTWGPYNKRLRDFVGKRDGGFLVGKRLRDFVGKRLRDFVGKRGNDDVFQDEKRLRDFVGKRSLTYSKRLRDFVGKRENSQFRQKRAREFVGKRDWVEIKDVQKRLRDFVGKRGQHYSGLFLPNAEKRLRDFVGKRTVSDTFSENKRLRDFVGKRTGSEIYNEDKRLRDFVGKRTGSEIFNEDKRLRDFVGKRTGSEIFSEDKRLRDFVGKRAESGTYREDKRLRDFVGKRDDKRAREFVGKRSESEEDTMPVFKRLRDFVGKRNYDVGLETPAVDKRIRDFVGRR